MAAIVFNGAQRDAIPGNGHTPAAINRRMDGPWRGAARFRHISRGGHGGRRRIQEGHHGRFHGAPRLRGHGGQKPCGINASAFSGTGWHLREAAILAARGSCAFCCGGRVCPKRPRELGAL